MKDENYKKRPELNSPAYNNSFYLNKHIDFLESQLKEVKEKRPWLCEELKDWSIVGMNHYYTGGVKQLFVAMSKNGNSIVEEGIDSVGIWERLIDQVLKTNQK